MTDLSDSEFDISIEPVDLLIIQPTPFCNLDCKYCYLPDKANTVRMSIPTVEAAVKLVADSPYTSPAGFTVVWHASEPTVLPPEWYRDAFVAINNVECPVPIRHSFQTNGTLLNKEWCDLILEHNIRVGISIDGPAYLNDRHRVSRAGKGTFTQALRGMKLLKNHGIDFHTITVLTSDSLNYADELFDFFTQHNIKQVGFNIEEIEGVNQSSSLEVEGADLRVRSFFSRMAELLVEYPETGIRVREFDGFLHSLHNGIPSVSHNQQSMPFAIVNVDVDGQFSTFSPELLGYRDVNSNSFMLGHVGTTSLEEASHSCKLRILNSEIRTGIEMCKSTCDYFPICGGGAPSNKLFEHNTFAATETLMCRNSVINVAEALLASYKKALA